MCYSFQFSVLSSQVTIARVASSQASPLDSLIDELQKVGIHLFLTIVNVVGVVGYHVLTVESVHLVWSPADNTCHF